jgi:2-(1,2-epoxy-1,2-dihydrophenyl)acetyl-CoA isomerase
MSYETLLFEVRDGVAWITLNRPAVFNALNLQMARELAEVAIRCDEDLAVRCAVMTGNGKAFFAGGDLAFFHAAGDGMSAVMKEMTLHLHGAISRLVRMDAPFIVAVNGVAAGAGMSMMLTADLAIAARSAKFTMAYTRAGLAPDGGSTYFLARLVGLRRAQELVLTNRTLSAEEALDWGIVNRVVDDAAFKGEVEQLARELAAGPTRALGAATRLIREGMDNSLETQMELEARTISEMGRSQDGREGIAAFIAKRRPAFVGR